jgi:MFS family permease
MYLPSLASGWLVRVIGIARMMLIGVACMFACVLVAVTVDHHFVHYFGGLALLGVGWNFLFVAGTTLLSSTCSAAERFRAQGFNDFVTFGSQAVASLLAGTALIELGWGALNLASVPLLVAMLAAIAWLHASERGRARAQAREA